MKKNSHYNKERKVLDRKLRKDSPLEKEEQEELKEQRVNLPNPLLQEGLN